MLKHCFSLAVILSFLSAVPGFAASKEYTQIITVNDYTYEIEVEGLRNPVNETIIIENLGDTPLVNPRITVNGRYDWFDMESIAREATLGCKTDEERAYAIFNFVRTNSHHLSPPGDRETLNPVVYFNVYGYANCGYHASVSVALARALGMKARVWEVWMHTINDFWFNNSWHMLDSDIEAYFLMDDNRTVASVEQLWEDQKVTMGDWHKAHLTTYSGRTIGLHAVYTDIEGNLGWAYRDSARSLGSRFFYDSDHCYVQQYYDYFTYEPHTMAMTLRPNEKLTRNWKGGPVFYDYKKHNANYEKDQRPWRKPIRYGDGQIVWTPDLKSENAGSYISSNVHGFRAKYNTSLYIEDGTEPAVHVKHKQGDVYRGSFATFSVKTPYTILGGSLKAKVFRGAATEDDKIAVSVYNDPRGGNRQQVWEAPEGATGSIDVEVDLDEILYPSGERGRRLYGVRFNLSANASNDPPTQTGVESIEMVTDIQCAPNSLPALSLGKNVIRYRDETPGPHKVKITHIWRERTDNHPPLPPKKPGYPKDGAVVNNLAPLFKWPASRDQDRKDKIADYYITISFDPQCRWPISTTLLTETGSAKPQWKLADGWLNRDTTYYWQIKARDSRDIWGGWSPVFRFKTAK